MQGCGIFHEAAFDLDIRSWSQVVSLVVEKSLADRLEGLCRRRPRFVLGAGRILPKTHLRIEILGDLPRAADIDRGDGAECHAALLVSEFKLENVAAIAARSHAQSEPRNVIIPYDVV